MELKSNNFTSEVGRDTDPYLLKRKVLLGISGILLTIALGGCEPYDPIKPYSTGTLTELPTPSLLPTITPTP